MISLAKVFIRSILKRFNLQLQPLNDPSADFTKRLIAEKLIEVLTTPYCGHGKNKAECVIFSMDRAMQLHAMLGSYFENIENPVPLHILYRATSEAHDKAYRDVFQEYDNFAINIVKHKSREDFRDQLLTILTTVNTQKVFFLVDDDLFIERFDLNDFAKLSTHYAIPSLRMGENLRESYTLQRMQPLPKLSPWLGVCAETEGEAHTTNSCSDNDMLSWIWSEGAYDWAYPLSVDGHLFSTAEIVVLAKHTEFNSPNTFEANLQAYSDFFKHRFGICYRKSRMVNIPCNKVQTDNDNIHGEIHQDELLAKWQEGLCINYRELYGTSNKSAHEELTITFMKRKQ